MSKMVEPSLTVRELSVEYASKRGQVKAVTDVSLIVDKGSTLGIVGESGSGKSTLGFAILNLIPSPGRIVAGKIIFDHTDILKQNEDNMRRIRGAEISMIFQDPLTSLNPLLKIRDHFTELFRVHSPSTSKEDATARAGNCWTT